MKSPNHVAEAMRQISEGDDFMSADDLTRDLTPDQACRVATGTPYSIATQVAHALLWQDHWLALIQGNLGDKVDESEDFPTVDCDQWPELRGRFVAGVELAEAVAGSDELGKVVGERTVGQLLLKIAVHNAYHLGQIALLRQVSGYGMPVYTHQQM